jgi:DNA repair protein RadC
VCTDVELLALVLGGGHETPEQSARAAELLAAGGGLAELDRADADRLLSCLGRGGRRRIVVVRAALELGRRAASEPPAKVPSIRSPADVYAHFRGRLPQLGREAFWMLLLDGRNRVRDELCVSEGTLTATLVHPREVFGPALRGAAAAVILVHNHPSGDPTPSAEDVQLTDRMIQAGELVGIRVLDHVVVAQGGWASVMDRTDD